MEKLFLKGVSQKYTYAEIGINHLTFELNKGEILAVVGGEKAGKTTLLKILAGLLDYQGEIFFDEQEISKLTPQERNVFLCFQNEGFFENKTVEYNLAYPLKIRGESKTDIEKKVLSCAKYFEIEHLLKADISRLLKRDRVKVSLARSLNRNAQLFLFDNPFFGLSYEEKRDILLKFASLTKEMPMVIFATCDLDEAKTVADKFLLLDYSVSADFGDLDTLLSRPASYTAMNIMEVKRVNTFEGILKKDAEGYYVVSSVNFRLPEKAKIISEEFIGKSVKVAFSPEFTKIGKGDNRMIGLYLGKESIGGRIQSIFSVGNVKVIAGQEYMGMKYSEAQISIAKDKLKVFDSKSENNIIIY